MQKQNTSFVVVLVLEKLSYRVNNQSLMNTHTRCVCVFRFPQDTWLEHQHGRAIQQLHAATQRERGALHCLHEKYRLRICNPRPVSSFAARGSAPAMPYPLGRCQTAARAALRHRHGSHPQPLHQAAPWPERAGYRGGPHRRRRQRQRRRVL